MTCDTDNVSESVKSCGGKCDENLKGELRQGSHLDWKIRKNGKAFSSQRKVREFFQSGKVGTMHVMTIEHRYLKTASPVKIYAENDRSKFYG